MSRASNSRRLWRLGRAGVTSLEFALVALLFLMLLIGCMDLGRYYLIVQSLRTVTAEAARAAQVNRFLIGPIDPTTAGITAITPFIDNADLTLTVAQTGSVGVPGINQVTVTAAYAFTPWVPLWNGLEGTINESTVLWY
jgi:Flp pilus assembly protein TadG